MSHLKRLAKAPLVRLAATFGPHQRDGEPKLWILMYHRVLPLGDPRARREEPGMIVSPETFEMHLQELPKLFEITTLQEWLAKKVDGAPLPPRSCVITFDDGWADNVEFAWPLLKRYELPATIFVVAGMLGSSQQFWPNRLFDLVAHVGDDWVNEPAFAEIIEGFNGDIQGLDSESLSALAQHLKRYPDADVHRMLDVTEERLKIAPPDKTDRERKPHAPTRDLMDWTQASLMAKSGRVTIGSHTLSHQRLVEGLDSGTMTAEIGDSKRLIDEKLSQNTSLFCYPNGDLTEAARLCVADNYDAAVTTVRGINTLETDPYALERIALHEGNSQTPLSLRATLANWF